MADIIALNREEQILLANVPHREGPAATLAKIAHGAQIKSRNALTLINALIAHGLIRRTADARFVLVRDARSMPTLFHYGVST